MTRQAMESDWRTACRLLAVALILVGSAWVVAGTARAGSLDALQEAEDRFEEGLEGMDGAADGVVVVSASLPVYGPEPYVYYPFWGYRFHPYYAMVDCDVDPEEALLHLDGEPLGEADDYDGFPSYLLLHPGAHTIEFRSPGRQSLLLRGVFRTGTFVRVERSLPPGEGRQTIELAERGSPPPPREETYGPPPRQPEAWAGPAGEPPSPPREQVEGEAPLPGGVEPPVREGEPPAPEQGLLELAVSPGDASVYLDNRFFGSGEEVGRLHGLIGLDPGQHSLQVVRPGYRGQTHTVTAVAGETLRLEVWLEAEIP